MNQSGIIRKEMASNLPTNSSSCTCLNLDENQTFRSQLWDSATLCSNPHLGTSTRYTTINFIRIPEINFPPSLIWGYPEILLQGASSLI